MKLKPARRKRYCKIFRNKLLPIITNDNNSPFFTGHFNGFCVLVTESNEMHTINTAGFFGKGNLSKSYPYYNCQKTPKILRQRQLTLRKKWKYDNYNEPNESVIFINDTDSENELREDDIINCLKPQLTETVLIKEILNLTLEEAYFLMNSIKCLQIFNKSNELLDLETAWRLFSNNQENFVQNFIVYHYFRARNWVVKSGLKFGGDFLLYKQGPPFFHASYLVIIDVLDSDTFLRIPKLCNRTFDWSSLVGINRMTETTAKEVLICQIIWPTAISLDDAKNSSNIIKSVSINTILMRRWNAKQERLCKNKK